MDLFTMKTMFPTSIGIPVSNSYKKPSALKIPGEYETCPRFIQECFDYLSDLVGTTIQCVSNEATIVLKPTVNIDGFKNVCKYDLEGVTITNAPPPTKIMETKSSWRPNI
jgi:hypothetical protein